MVWKDGEGLGRGHDHADEPGLRDGTKWATTKLHDKSK